MRALQSRTQGSCSAHQVWNETLTTTATTTTRGIHCGVLNRRPGQCQLHWQLRGLVLFRRRADFITSKAHVAGLSRTSTIEQPLAVALRIPTVKPKQPRGGSCISSFEPAPHALSYPGMLQAIQEWQDETARPAASMMLSWTRSCSGAPATNAQQSRTTMFGQSSLSPPLSSTAAGMLVSGTSGCSALQTRCLNTFT